MLLSQIQGPFTPEKGRRAGGSQNYHSGLTYFHGSTPQQRSQCAKQNHKDTTKGTHPLSLRHPPAGHTPLNRIFVLRARKMKCTGVKSFLTNPRTDQVPEELNTGICSRVSSGNLGPLRKLKGRHRTDRKATGGQEGRTAAFPSRVHATKRGDLCPLRRVRRRQRPLSRVFLNIIGGEGWNSMTSTTSQGCRL